jgi:hypothetical protein
MGTNSGKCYCSQEKVRRHIQSINLQLGEARDLLFKRTLTILLGRAENSTGVRIVKAVADLIDFSKYEIVQYESDRGDEFVIEAREKGRTEKPVDEAGGLTDHLMREQITEKREAPVAKCESYWDGNQCDGSQGHEGKHSFMGWTWAVDPPPLTCKCGATITPKGHACGYWKPSSGVLPI